MKKLEKTTTADWTYIKMYIEHWGHIAIWLFQVADVVQSWWHEKKLWLVKDFRVKSVYFSEKYISKESRR